MLNRKYAYRILFWLLLLIGLFNTIDFFATRDLVTFGDHLEWNPLMRAIVNTSYFALYKLVFIPLGLVVLWVARRTLVPKYFGLIAFVCGVYGLLVLYTWRVFYA